MGKAVSQKAQEGGGWLTWEFSTEDIAPIERKFGCDAVDGHRTRPNGSDLKWKQIGVREIIDSCELRLFIQWLTADHPSQDGTAVSKIVIADKDQLADSCFKQEILRDLAEVTIDWVDPSANDGGNGIVCSALEHSQRLSRIGLIPRRLSSGVEQHTRNA